jgi:hypothetical protein
MGKRAWMKLIAQNRQTIYGLVKEGAGKWRDARRQRAAMSTRRAQSEESAR